MQLKRFLSFALVMGISVATLGVGVSAATFKPESTTTSMTLTWKASTSGSKTTYTTERSGTGFMGRHTRKAGTKSDFGVEHHRNGAEYRFVTGIVNNAASGNNMVAQVALYNDKTGTLVGKTSATEVQKNLGVQHPCRINVATAAGVPAQYFTISTGYIRQAPTVSSPIINEYKATIHDKK